MSETPEQRAFSVEAVRFARREACADVLAEEDEKYLAVIDRMIDLEQALRLFVDDEDCRLDHHGYCQEHGVTKPCRNAWARVLLGMDG